ncbi:MAG: hypothetical protein ABW185_20010, partial [Sedimenticola sp.]
DQFEQPEQYDDYECDENVSEYHPYDPENCIDTESLEEGASAYEPSLKKQKMSEHSVFKNLCDKFNHKEVVDSEVNDDLVGFINTAFRDGITDERQNEIMKEINRPQNCEALAKTRVNQSIWRLLKPHTQTEDVKMQNVQSLVIKAASNLAKLLDKGGDVLDPEMLEWGTNALGLLGQSNKQINNKRKEAHKLDLDPKYQHLCSSAFPFTDNLYGDDVNKNVREISDMNRLGRDVGRGMGRGRRPFRGRPFRMRGRSWGRGVGRALPRCTDTYASAGPKNPRQGHRR